ncbi:MAG: hypothetical protein LKG40_07470 [Lachnospiraceae bacterium]|jgi:hypothetical protein|nr:hypothetical protein [Lachnospiraceae bacterium]MCI1329323.1 hypothetical protein [Lachnospiraceae bacterium]
MMNMDISQAVRSQPRQSGNRKRVWLFRSLYFIAMTILAVLRVRCGLLVGNYFLSAQSFDDALMMRYAAIRTHFTSPDAWSLCKTMGYPLFILAGHVLHISYTMMVNLLWVAAAFSFWRMMERLFRQHILSLLLYAYVLFFPTAFDYLIGTRIYRNSIIAPFVLLTFSLMMLNLYACAGKEEKTCVMIFRALLTGLIFTFTCYIKEDGAWIVVSAGFFSAVCLIALVVRTVRRGKRERNLRSFAVRVICLILPGVIYFAGTEWYLSLNKKYFGVREIQTRTEGELGEFSKNLYAVEAEGRSAAVWVPKDAIDQIVEVSPTLQSETGFLKDLYHSPWCGEDLMKNPFRGDLITWAVRYALDQSGLWTSDAEVENLFARINREVEAAFRDGRLKKSDRFQLQSSAGGMTKAEIRELFPLVRDAFRCAVHLDSYNATISDNDTTNPEMTELAEKMTGLHNLAENRDEQKRAAGEKSGRRIFAVYRVINPVLLALSVLMIVLSVLRAIITAVHEKRDAETSRRLRYAGCVFVFLGIGAVYAFAIAWFTCFLFEDGVVVGLLNFYSVGLPAIFAMAYGIGAAELVRMIRRTVAERMKRTQRKQKL